MGHFASAETIVMGTILNWSRRLLCKSTFRRANLASQTFDWTCGTSNLVYKFKCRFYHILFDFHFYFKMCHSNIYVHVCVILLHLISLTSPKSCLAFAVPHSARRPHPLTYTAMYIIHVAPNTSHTTLYYSKRWVAYSFVGVFLQRWLEVSNFFSSICRPLHLQSQLNSVHFTTRSFHIFWHSSQPAR